MTRYLRPASSDPTRSMSIAREHVQRDREPLEAEEERHQAPRLHEERHARAGRGEERVVLGDVLVAHLLAVGDEHGRGARRRRGSPARALPSGRGTCSGGRSAPAPGSARRAGPRGRTRRRSRRSTEGRSRPAQRHAARTPRSSGAAPAPRAARATATARTSRRSAVAITVRPPPAQPADTVPSGLRLGCGATTCRRRRRRGA